MAEILKIDGDKVKIGNDDGKVVTVPLSVVNYDNPKFGWLTLGIWYLVDWIIALSKAYGSSYGNVEDITFDANGNYIK